MDKILMRNKVRASEEEGGRLISGYAVVFDELSVNIGFYETIHRGAITQEVLDQSDVFALFDHREDIVLARSRYGKGSLQLTLDEIGVKYSFEAPNTIYGDEVLEHIRRGELEGSSFAFTIPDEEGAQAWHKDENGVIYRDVYKIDRIYDISPVFEPAYAETTCSLRAKEIKDKSELIDAKMNLLTQEIEALVKEK